MKTGEKRSSISQIFDVVGQYNKYEELYLITKDVIVSNTSKSTALKMVLTAPQPVLVSLSKGIMKKGIGPLVQYKCLAFDIS